MKRFGKALAPLAIVVTLVACDDITSLDNYDPPSSTLTGRVVYNGEPIGVRHGGVELELWEPGFELNQKIPVNVAQDGSFSAVLFDGSYQLTLLRGNGPWVSETPDTIPVELNGESAVDFPVTPYYLIRNVSASHVDGAIQATFNVEEIDTSRDLELVGLYIGVTRYVDRINSIDVPDAERERSRAAILPQLKSNGSISISVDLPDDIYETNSSWRRTHVYVRVGVKTFGVAEMAFSPVQKIAI